MFIAYPSLAFIATHELFVKHLLCSQIKVKFRIINALARTGYNMLM